MKSRVFIAAGYLCLLATHTTAQDAHDAAAATATSPATAVGSIEPAAPPGTQTNAAVLPPSAPPFAATQTASRSAPPIASGATQSASVTATESPASDNAALPTEVTWQDLLTIVHTRSPRLRAVRTQIAVAKADVEVAGVLPNPTLGYTGFSLLGRGDNYGTQHQVQFEQPLWLAGQRGARVRSARARTKAVESETQLSEAELDQAVLHAFVALLATQTKLAQLHEVRVAVADVERTVRERVNAGAESTYDEQRIALEAAQLDTRIAQADADNVDASANLAATLGMPGWQPRALGSLTPLGVHDDTRELGSHADQASPSLAVAAKRTESARREIDVARAERWGELTLTGGAFITTDRSSVSAFLGVAAPIPLFNFGGAAIDRAQAAFAQAQAEQSATRAELHATLLGAVSVLKARRNALLGYDSNVLGRVPGLRAMAETAYKAGSASLLELLDSVRSGIDITLGRIDLLSAELDAEVDVLAASGQLPGH